MIGFGDMFFQFQFPLAGAKTTLRISDEKADIFKLISGPTFVLTFPFDKLPLSYL